MSLPGVFKPTEINLDAVVATDAGNITTNFQFLSDVLGLVSSPTQQTAAAFTISAAGVLAILQANPTVAGNPTVATGIAPKQYVDKLGPFYGSATGTNTYVVSLTSPNSAAPTSWAALTGVPLFIKCANANTGAATLNVNSLGAKAIQAQGAALSAGEIPGGQYVLMMHDGTAVQLISNATALQGVGISATAPTAGQVLQLVSGIWTPVSLPAINQFLQSDITTASVGSGAVVTLWSNTLTLPSRGGPWRIQFQYRLYCHGSNAMEVWASDGTYHFCGTTISAGSIGSSAGSSSMNSTEISPATYANSAVVNLTINGRTAAGTNTAADTSNIQGYASTAGFAVVATG